MIWYKKNILNIIKGEPIKALGIIVGVLAILISICSIADNFMYYDANDPKFTGWQVPLVQISYIVICLIYLLLLYKRYYTVICILFVAEIIFMRSQFINKLPDFQLIQDKSICDDLNYCNINAMENISLSKCLEEDAVWNVDDNACLFYFDKESCNKLKGNWVYPKICE